ncbi:MAG: hypothetical protein LBG78_09015 [Azoarcus sp.]|jgi:HTH-type transcriptional regulator/antitoxin HigA|nr:hypothetical protein [Azoarcus sp.]
MNIKPIHTADDYNAALARVDELWGAAPGTPEGEELEVLAVLLGSYEENADALIPIGINPIDAITCLMEQRGL